MIQKLENSTRLHHLDALRGLAALSVAYMHCLCLVSVDYVQMNLLGRAPVIFFFLLSGFVLSRSLCKKEGLSFNGILGYYIRRIFRLYPAILGALILASVAARFYVSPESIHPPLKIPFSTMLDEPLAIRSFHGYLDATVLKDFRLDHPLWTIRTEFLCSALLPVILILVNYWRFLTMPLVLIFTILLARGDLLGFPRHDIFAPQYFFLPFYLGYLIYLDAPEASNLTQRSTEWLLFFGAVLLFVTVNKGMTDVNTVDAVESIILGGVLLVLIPCNWPRLKNLLLTPSMQFLGRISYSFYLFHVPVLCFVWSMIARMCPQVLYLHSHFIIISLLFILSLALTIPLAHAMELYIEQPWNKLGHSLATRIQKKLTNRALTA